MLPYRMRSRLAVRGDLGYSHPRSGSPTLSSWGFILLLSCAACHNYTLHGGGQISRLPAGRAVEAHGGPPPASR